MDPYPRPSLSLSVGKTAVPTTLSLAGWNPSSDAVTVAPTCDRIVRRVRAPNAISSGASGRRPARPNGITNFARIDGVPEVLALLLAVLGTLAVTHILAAVRLQPLPEPETLATVTRPARAAWDRTGPDGDEFDSLPRRDMTVTGAARQ